MNLINSDLHDLVFSSDLHQILVQHHNLKLMVLQIRIYLLAVCLLQYLLQNNIHVERFPQFDNPVIQIFNLVIKLVSRRLDHLVAVLVHLLVVLI